MNNNELNFTINYFCTQLNNCKECSKLFNMPYRYCCLEECHEHEFCRNCNNGIHNDNFKNRNCGCQISVAEEQQSRNLLEEYKPLERRR